MSSNKNVIKRPCPFCFRRLCIFKVGHSKINRTSPLKALLSDFISNIWFFKRIEQFGKNLWITLCKKFFDGEYFLKRELFLIIVHVLNSFGDFLGLPQKMLTFVKWSKGNISR